MSRARGSGDALPGQGTGRWSRPLYAFAIVACALLWALHFAELGARMLAAGRALDGAGVAAGLLGLALGVLLADFATGLAHWACDSYGDERTPLIGPSVIRSFREHHEAPRAMLAHDALEVNGQPAAAASGVLALLALPGARAALEQSLLAYGLACSLLGVAALGNQLHQWSHHGRPPAPVRVLQRRGWVLSPRAHARHHGGSHDHAYCIATGWCNGVLDRLGFWRALERAVEQATGTRARGAGSAAHRGPRRVAVEWLERSVRSGSSGGSGVGGRRRERR